MLAKQVITDQQGMPMGVFIPMQAWKSLTLQYPDIEETESDIQQWEKDFIDERLAMVQQHPERLKSVEMLLNTL